MLDLFVQLVYRVGFIIMIAFVFSKASISKNVINDKDISLTRKITLGLFFALLSIIGTYTGISFEGAIVNTRVIGAAVGGLIGGPITGLIAGATAGLHRYLIDIGGFTALSCAISTTAEGLIAGLLSKKFLQSKDKVAFAISVGIVIEALQMIIILMVAKPFSDALHLVSIIAFPMILMNSIGIGVFIMIIENIKSVSDLQGAFRSYQTLLIADKTLGQLRSNLDKSSAENIAQTIYDATDFDAVSITDHEHVLTHIGLASDHHAAGLEIQTGLTKKFVENIKEIEVNTKIQCPNEDCPLDKAIIVPLIVSEEFIGTLKLYKGKNSITTKSDIELAKGLGNIFSTQLELSKLDYQKNLRVKAELHALQAQINPHFLFNAINTIVSLTRSNPEKARELLLYLSEYFRHNMNNTEDLITLEQELNHVKAYLRIEKARFEDKISVIYNNAVEETVFLPPLTIQPIVENAVKHGLLNKANGGEISLNIKIKSDKLCIEIKDDGIGISDDLLDKIVRYQIDSVGINNVRKRIDTFYQRKGSFKIDSTLDEGTTVKMLLPIIRNKSSIGGYHD